jgi:hypothetical protein
VSKHSGRIDLMLIRHVRSSADDERGIEGVRDSPLMDVGRAPRRKRGGEFGGRGEVSIPCPGPWGKLSCPPMKARVAVKAFEAGSRE